MIATITREGYLTLPEEVRRRMNLKTGDRLEFVMREEGNLEVVLIHQSMKRLKGMVPPPKRPVSLEEMAAAISMGGED